MNHLEKPNAHKIFTASISDVRPFASILRGVMLSNRATLIISNAGITVTVEEMRTSLGKLSKAYVLKAFFDEFEYNPPLEVVQDGGMGESGGPTTFEIALDTFLECLNVFGSGNPSASFAPERGSGKRGGWQMREGEEDTEEPRPRDNAKVSWSKNAERATMMKMTYQEIGAPLSMILAEEASGPTTTVEMVTLEAAENLDLPFDDGETIARIIMKSSLFRDAVTEVDATCERLSFICTPRSAQRAQIQGSNNRGPQIRAVKPAFRIHAAGAYGTTEMDFPNDRDVLETFDCDQPVEATPLYRVVRSLTSSAKTSIRIESSGLLSIQFQLPKNGFDHAFIELLVKLGL
ncbi:Rad1/Rec1/Rad17 [Cantharellus anzutake]|uniref:Rad1/Rec1/Rad17 n=1 Tax=Cantharellus anzutake TaxID=1750568 RepID=UPI0019069591|nr:Rad1/Rec1/Rad17 [Cantharellus anzutake]KAF8334037.1 Rad1/Rec1/Rad17 [Cantharellus anzutake]